MATTPHTRRAIPFVCALWFIWSYNWIVVKEGLAFSGPFDFSALRCIFGSLVMFSVLKILKKPLAPPPLTRTFLLGLLSR
jgi:drug/metabolite transporter (DMT)-like permease